MGRARRPPARLDSVARPRGSGELGRGHRRVARLRRDPVDAEGVEISPAALGAVASAGEGSLRDAESLLEQVVAYCGRTVRDEEVAAVRSALAEYGTTYPVGLDTGDRIAKQYGITGTPETFIIAPDGNVAYVHIGPISGAALSAQLDALLK